MTSLSLGECAEPAGSPIGSVELAVSSRRRSRRARRWAFNTTAGLVALLVLAFALPPAFGLSRHTITDDSMSGTMERGTAVFAKSLPLADLEVGDVITYRRPATSGDDLITRRVADIKGGVIWTRSDGTGAIDPWTLTSAQSRQARVVLAIPLAGFAYDAISGAARALWTTVAELR